MDRKNTVFLDSSMRNSLGRRSYIGMIPYRIHTPANSDALNILNKIDDDTMIMGFLSYDYGMRIHGIDSIHPESSEPEFMLADFDVVIEEIHA